MLHLVVVMVVKFAIFSSILYHYMKTKFMMFMDSEIFGLWFSNVNTVSVVHICDTRLYPPYSVTSILSFPALLSVSSFCIPVCFFSHFCWLNSACNNVSLLPCIDSKL